VKYFYFRIICVSACLFLTGSLGFAKTLTVIILANASTQDVMQSVLEEYSRDNRGIDFNVSIIQYGVLTAKVNTLVTAGEPPDILEVTTSYIQTFAEQALDLAQYTNRVDFLNRYLPAYQGFIRSGDKVIGIPIEATVNGLFYHKDLFKEAGVSTPADPDHVWTWLEFKDSLQKIMKLPSCRVGVAFDCSVQRSSNLLYQANGRWISADGKRILPDREAAKEALTYFRSLVEAKLVPTSSWPGKTDSGPLFKTGVLKPMLADLAVTPQWVAEDLARPELNLLQNDLLDQLTLFSTGRTRLDDTVSEIEKLVQRYFLKGSMSGGVKG
jgi:ABC-type glycerol-3-phosphate transport system substrate-binding protein